MKTKRPKVYQERLSLNHMRFEQVVDRVLAYNPKKAKKTKKSKV
jgi:hypothetical protein